jgi:CBS domain-containing protein
MKTDENLFKILFISFLMDLSDFQKLTIAEVMDDRIWDLPLIEKNASIKIALILLTGRGYGWVVHGRSNMELLGIITEHDVLSLFSVKNQKEVRKAKDLMRSNPITSKRDETIGDTLKKINKYGIRRLPVVEGNKLIGEVTLRHLIEKYYSLFLFRK